MVGAYVNELQGVLGYQRGQNTMLMIEEAWCWLVGVDIALKAFRFWKRRGVPGRSRGNIS